MDWQDSEWVKRAGCSYGTSFEIAHLYLHFNRCTSSILVNISLNSFIWLTGGSVCEGLHATAAYDAIGDEAKKLINDYSNGVPVSERAFMRAISNHRAGVRTMIAEILPQPIAEAVNEVF